ncbi:hypothetical protein PR202_gb18164 [Eleusine coracana subsp. coracana]|uniref:Uncharacterized protein n=1 Tax=Eleusine coracana subsp. coracana TaxID=191504 RepID=A0AAV5F4P4_ELECO|nr:hypothetical protein PR202_gb18164 [Eleusine coracana subsp. coracana]
MPSSTVGSNQWPEAGILKWRYRKQTDGLKQELEELESEKAACIVPSNGEEDTVVLRPSGSRLEEGWSSIATKLPGRTDNEIKNYWNTHLRKKLLKMGIDPVTHRPRTDLINILSAGLPNLLAAVNLGTTAAMPTLTVAAHINKLYADAAKLQLLLSAITAAATPGVDITALLAAITMSSESAASSPALTNTKEPAAPAITSTAFLCRH